MTPIFGFPVKNLFPFAPTLYIDPSFTIKVPSLSIELFKGVPLYGLFGITMAVQIDWMAYETDR